MDLEINYNNNTDYYYNNNNNSNININFDNNNTNKSSPGNAQVFNIFAKNRNAIYALEQPPHRKNRNLNSGELTMCEGRLINDLAEFKRSKLVGKNCQIKLKDYKKIQNDNFELIVEFESYFSVKFVFDSNYPCSPPKIKYLNGSKPKNIFDDDGNVLIESIKKSNWTPSLWLSTLVYSIELLISSGNNNENNCTDNDKDNSNHNNYFANFSNNYWKNKIKKYGKRKWDVYIDECNDYYSKECIILPELEKNLKQLKIK